MLKTLAFNVHSDTISILIENAQKLVINVILGVIKLGSVSLASQDGGSNKHNVL